MDGSFGDNVGVQSVAEIDRIDVVAVQSKISLRLATDREFFAYHSRSLYIIVKKTWRNKLTAFINTANKYNHASPDIMPAVVRRRTSIQESFRNFHDTSFDVAGPLRSLSRGS